MSRNVAGDGLSPTSGSSRSGRRAGAGDSRHDGGRSRRGRRSPSAQAKGALDSFACLYEFFGRDVLLAGALGWDEATVAMWRGRGVVRPQVKKAGQVVLLLELCEEARPYLREDRQVGEWVTTALPNLRGATPAQWLLARGQRGLRELTYGLVDWMPRLPAGKVQEEAVGKGCITYLYAYNAESDRTSETKREPGTGGACATTGGTTTTHTYDEAGRLTGTGIEYEPFGANTTLPASDAGGHTLESSYYTNGALYSQTQNNQTTYTLDPTGRALETTTTKGTSSKTTTSNYCGTSSTACWTETEGSVTRNIAGIDGTLAATQTNGGEATIDLLNLHGDVVGTTSDNSGAESASLNSEPTAFGVPTSTSPSTEKYGWLGGDGLQTEFAEAGIQASAAGAYIPQLGLHLNSQGLAGAAAQDPVNEYLANQPIAQPHQEGPETGPMPPPPSPVEAVMVPAPPQEPPSNEPLGGYAGWACEYAAETGQEDPECEGGGGSVVGVPGGTISHGGDSMIGEGHDPFEHGCAVGSIYLNGHCTRVGGKPRIIHRMPNGVKAGKVNIEASIGACLVGGAVGGLAAAFSSVGLATEAGAYAGCFIAGGVVTIFEEF